MKIKYLKQHHHHKPGEEAEIKDSVARYLLKVGVATVETVDDKAIDKTLSSKLKSTKKKK